MEKSTKKRIAILGSTGSIGTQTLDVISRFPDRFEVELLTARNSYELLIDQAAKFKPNVVVIENEAHYDKVFSALDPLEIKVYTGAKAIAGAVEAESIDLVVTAIVGSDGLEPTIRAIKAGKNIALANKETLVVAGALVTRLAMEKGVNIYPIDSEHSAIFQCLVGEFQNKIEKIILTASGGPFRGKDINFLKTVKKEQALKHPNWSMGAKITIDSASMMNKGLEVIEGKWLFNLKPSQIETVIHPQSIIHSMVQFEDGSIKAQMGMPDMRIPIQFALTYPDRFKADYPRFDFRDYPALNFEKPDLDTFRNLRLAYDALNTGGNMPCVLNAANEVAVDQFLKGNIGFLEMSDVVASCMSKLPFIKDPCLEEYVQTDKETRTEALELIG